MPTPAIVHVGGDESGSLSAPTSLFVLAAVVTPNQEATRNLIRRAAIHSGKRLGRMVKPPSELKWSNASDHIRSDVLKRLAGSDVELFALVVHKENRRIEDSPENYAILVCELLNLAWGIHPNMALLLDRHFTAPAQIASVDTFIHRHWIQQGVVSINHVDSQRSTLVQLADFVAGCIYDWQREQNVSYKMIEARMRTIAANPWQGIKEQWLDREKQKTRRPD